MKVMRKIKWNVELFFALSNVGSDDTGGDGELRNKGWRREEGIAGEDKKRE